MPSIRWNLKIQQEKNKKDKKKKKTQNQIKKNILIWYEIIGAV